MINIPPIRPSTQITTELLPEITRLWKIGTVLNATVEKGGEAMNRVLLSMGRYQLEARTPVALKEGETVKLVVRSLGDTPRLAIQSQADLGQLAANKLRGVIAQQQDIGVFLQRAGQLLNDPRLSPPVRTSIQQFVQQLPDAEQLRQPQQLKAFIQNSGPWLEPRLLQSHRALPRDIKANLLQISQALETNDLPRAQGNDGRPMDMARAIQSFMRGDTALRPLVASLTAGLNTGQLSTLLKYLAGDEVELPAPLALRLPQLVRHIQQQANGKQLMENLMSLLRNLPPLQDLKNAVDQALARITSQQLTPMTRDGDSPLLVFFDLPVRDRDKHHVFQFAIEQEAGSAEADRNSWTVTINFDMDPLGPVQARLHLVDNQVSTVFHAHRTDTANRIQQHMDWLASAYDRAGLQVGQLDVIVGAPPKSPPVSDRAHILDEQA